MAFEEMRVCENFDISERFPHVGDRIHSVFPQHVGPQRRKQATFLIGVRRRGHETASVHYVQ